MLEFGVTGLEIAPSMLFYDAIDPFAPSFEAVDEVSRELKERELSILSMQSLLYGTTGALLFGEPEARNHFCSCLHRAIDLAARLEVPNLVFGSPMQRVIPPDLSMKEAFDIAVEIFSKLSVRAKEYGTKIAIEANPVVYGTNFLNTTKEVMRFVTSLDCSNIVANLDFGAIHVNREYDGVIDSLEGILKYVGHVHISEAHLAPVPQDLDLLINTLRALDNSNYAKAVSIEMRRPPDGIIGVRTSLQKLSEAAKER